MPYFSSHNHSDMSNFRLLDAINRPSDLFDRAIELGLTGFAITDHEALSAHKQIMDIRDSKIKEGSLPADFTVAFGNEAYLVDELVSGQDYYHWLLIAKDKKGHSILRKLSSQAWDNMYTDRGMARVPLTKAQVESIMEENGGKGHIIATSACLGGEIGKNLLSIKGVIDSGGKPTEDLLQRVNDNISNYIAWNKKVFGEDDFYLEIAPNTKGDQRFVNQKMKNISKSTGTRIIFATDSHYLRKEDQPIHRAFLNSSDGEREVDEFYSTAYMMDFEEVHDMLSLDFSEEEIEEMVENLEHMRSKVSHYDLNHEQVIPKVEVDPHGIEYRIPTDKDREYISKMLESDEEQNLYWVRKCLSELDKRDKWSEKYLDALEDEARVLYRISERLHQPMSSYYNTAEKLVDLMWNEGNSLVGPGRGSATAFLSNWLLDITQVDPLEYELPYWRHLSEERPELPDVDLDSEGFKREEINKALKGYFGEDRVLNICTYGTEKSKSSILTACRGLGISNEVGAYLGGLIPNERGFDWSLKDVYYGNKEKGRRPVGEFVAEIDKHEGLLDVSMRIEGLVTSRGSHAAGVYIFNDEYTHLNAMMKTPSGMKVTQWNMDESDAMGGLKFDFLSIEGLDKIRASIELLLKDGLMEDKGSLKETYDFYLGTDKLESTKEIWEPAWRGEVLDLFQFQTAVGGEAIKKGQPQTVNEAAALNSLMRLMPMEDGTNPTDKFVYFKDDISRWYDELKKYEIPESEIPILERHYLTSYGVPNTQEELMMLLMDEEVAGFSVTEANVARKIVGKKQMEKIPWLRQEIFSKARCSEKTIHYIWDTAIGVQMGYSFSLPHTVAYTLVALKELNLYHKFPSVYWNTACLIVNSGDEGDSTDYAKIALAIGGISQHGVTVNLPDVNVSEENFTPDASTNSIYYGLRPISGIGDDFVQELIQNRPYSSMEDLQAKLSPTKTQMLALIKSGAFDSLHPTKQGEEARRDTLMRYAKMTAPRRKTVTIASIPVLIKTGVFPMDEFEKEYRIYEFNRYLRDKCKKGDKFILDERTEQFFVSIMDSSHLEYDENGSLYTGAKEWGKLYNTAMDPVRDWNRKHKEEILDSLASAEAKDLYLEFGGGERVSKWEMDSLSYYHSPHELSYVDHDRYGFANFSELPEEPEIREYGFYPKYYTESILGTVLEKNKTKGSVNILTPDGSVVLLKMYKGMFSHYDKQVAEYHSNGSKTILEKSWFQRGNKIFVHGFRRGDQFVPKTYADTPFPTLALITSISSDGEVGLKTERG